MRRKSRAEHRAEGSYRPSRHGSDASAPPQAPSKPRGLGAEQAKLWDELTGLLSDRLRPEDGAILLIGVRWLCTWREASAALEGMAVGTLEYARTLSAVSIASQRFETIAKKLGMSPSDRETMSLESPGSGVLTWR